MVHENLRRLYSHRLGSPRESIPPVHHKSRRALEKQLSVGFFHISVHQAHIGIVHPHQADWHSCLFRPCLKRPRES